METKRVVGGSVPGSWFEEACSSSGRTWRCHGESSVSSFRGCQRDTCRQESRCRRKPKGWLEVRFAVHGSWFMVRGLRAFVRRRVGAGFSAAGPRVPRGRAPPGQEVPTEPKGSPFSVISFHLGFCVCVCVCEASSGKVEIE